MSDYLGASSRRRWLIRFVVTYLGIYGPWVMHGVPWSVGQEPPTPEELVRRLGDEQYAVREQAANQLVARGLAAVPALQEGTRALDREIRYRCERILVLIRKTDFHSRLAAFAADPTGEKDYGLPGWTEFRTSFGRSAAARQFYIDMVRAEPDLFEALSLGAKEAAEAVEGRAVQVQQQPLALAGEAPAVNSIAALLFLMSQPDVRVSDGTATFVLNQCFQGPFEAALQDGQHRSMLRQLLGQVVSQTNDWPAYTAIRLALRYDLKEGLRPAERVLQGGPNAGLVYVRQFALLAIGRFGDPSHTQVVESVLEDATPCVPAQVANRQAYETQLRDVALAVLWKLHGEDPRQHGFGARVQDDPQLGFHPSTLGFTSEQERQAAIDEWRRFRAQLKNQSKNPTMEQSKSPSSNPSKGQSNERSKSPP